MLAEHDAPQHTTGRATADDVVDQDVMPAQQVKGAEHDVFYSCMPLSILGVRLMIDKAVAVGGAVGIWQVRR